MTEEQNALLARAAELERQIWRLARDVNGGDIPLKHSTWFSAGFDELYADIVRRDLEAEEAKQ
jgi:hypothetical protein